MKIFKIFQAYHLYASRSDFRVNNNTTSNISSVVTSASPISERFDSLTVVTGYFNLGTFQKGVGKIFSNALYRQWMTVFASINNPVIAFWDTDNDLEFFTKVRNSLPSNLTKLIKVRRSELWAFSLEDRISKIFKQPGYPQHHPNTVNPAYSMAMHAKYELMDIAIRENPFKTKYFCWLDIGLFRDLTSRAPIDNPAKPLSPLFRLELPFNFSTDSVAYTQVYPRNTKFTLRQIIYNNEAWVCGCYFVGEGSVLMRWTQEYRNATLAMLDNNLMSTDQQVIYFMFNALKPTTRIQTYIGDGRFDEWFYLGYISRHVS